MASPIVESTASGNSGGNTTSHVVTMPTGVTAGDLLFIFIACNDSTTFTAPTGWTQLYQGTNNGGGLDMTGAGFYKKSDGTEGASETVTSSASRTSGWTAYRISGHDPLTAPAVTVINTGASANPNPVSLSPAGGSNDYRWLAVQHHRRVTSVTSFPSGYSGGINGTVGGGGANTGTASAHKASTASSEDPGAFTNDNDKIWMAVTVGVYPAPPVTANETITFEGFESGALYDMDVTQGANGSFTASSAQASNGTYSARVQATSTTSNQAYLNLPWYFDTRGVVYTASNFSHINVQFRLRIATAPAGDVRLVYANNATTYPLYLTSARKIKLDTQESAALDLDTWYTIAYQARGDRRWQVTVWNADLSQQIFSYGVLVVGGAITHSELRIGITESTANANGMDVYIDDILVEADNTAFPITTRDYAIKKKGIAGNGTHTAWTGSYTDIDEIPISDNVADEIAATANGQIETYSLNSNATDGIDAGRYLGVKVDTGFDVGDTSIVDNTVVLYSGTTREDSEAYPFADGDLHRFRKIFEVDPHTGVRWTEAGIEAMEPGVRCVTDGSNNRCLWVAVEVAFELPYPKACGVSGGRAIQHAPRMAADAGRSVQLMAQGGVQAGRAIQLPAGAGLVAGRTLVIDPVDLALGIGRRVSAPGYAAAVAGRQIATFARAESSIGRSAHLARVTGVHAERTLSLPGGAGVDAGRQIASFVGVGAAAGRSILVDAAGVSVDAGRQIATFVNASAGAGRAILVDAAGIALDVGRAVLIDAASTGLGLGHAAHLAASVAALAGRSILVHEIALRLELGRAIEQAPGTPVQTAVAAGRAALNVDGYHVYLRAVGGAFAHVGFVPAGGDLQLVLPELSDGEYEVAFGLQGDHLDEHTQAVRCRFDVVAGGVAAALPAVEDLAYAFDGDGVRLSWLYRAQPGAQIPQGFGVWTGATSPVDVSGAYLRGVTVDGYRIYRARLSAELATPPFIAAVAAYVNATRGPVAEISVPAAPPLPEPPGDPHAFNREVTEEDEV